MFVGHVLQRTREKCVHLMIKDAITAGDATTVLFVPSSFLLKIK